MLIFIMKVVALAKIKVVGKLFLPNIQNNYQSIAFKKLLANVTNLIIQ